MLAPSINVSNSAQDNLLRSLHEIISQRLLIAVFQPIVQMQGGEIIGYEGLIRGPSDSPLHAPMMLFKVARAHKLTLAVEQLCRQVVLERFAELALPGKLFLNVSPECLLQHDAGHCEMLDAIKTVGIDPARIIIELTENEPTYDYKLLLEAVVHYRQMGFQIAIDDLGEGFSSLRLWSELRPEYVKIDMHFIQGIHQDPVKQQFVASIQEIAKKSGTLVIAEGIETQAELLIVQDLSVACGQGYHIARPHAQPAKLLSAEVNKALIRKGIPVRSHREHMEQKNMTVAKLLRSVPIVSSDTLNNVVYDIFLADPQLQILPVVDQGVPVGLINRFNMIDHYARPYQREIYGRKSISVFMDTRPLLVDQGTRLQDFSHIIVAADPHHLFNGFIITEQGQYLGMGTAHDLMREITQMQIRAARHANPLTLLPGNVPINEHIDQLLQNASRFVACYVDLDHFKPFNDVHGYRKGDDVIELTGKLLQAHCDPSCDFIGHIGGDDFMILFQSLDWEERCKRTLASFADAIQNFYSIEDRERGGYISEDRQGKKVFYSLISLSLGAIRVDAGQYYSHHQIATAAAEAKKQAKKMHGNSLFIDRRQQDAETVQLDK
ncbi:MAG: GGDEF domain-containing protein [Pseudomonadota bacterium]